MGNSIQLLKSSHSDLIQELERLCSSHSESFRLKVNSRKNTSLNDVLYSTVEFVCFVVFDVVCLFWFFFLLSHLAANESERQLSSLFWGSKSLYVRFPISSAVDQQLHH